VSNFIIIHTLRNYAASNLNRGEDGSPKYMYFGGERRGRISSQSIKRVIRLSTAFDEFRDQGQMDIRTRQLPVLLTEEFERRGLYEDEIKEIVDRVHELGRKEAKESKKDDRTDQLILLSPKGAEKLADQLLALRQTSEWDKKSLNDMKIEVHEFGVDTALFGAMSTSTAFPSPDGACLVSHAMSTNRTYKAIDYFTAVDDITGKAGFLHDDAEFNANCYYWTLAVDKRQLLKNLSNNQDLMDNVLTSLLNGIVLANPSGKQHTFSSHPFPALLMVEKRNVVFDYADAFVKPIEPGDELDLISASIAALSSYMQWCDTTYDLPVERRYLARQDDNLPVERAKNLTEIIEWATH